LGGNNITVYIKQCRYQ